MDQMKHDESAKHLKVKSLLPHKILGLLAGGILGFVVAYEVAPLLVPFLVKPSVFILDPAVIVAGLFIIVVGVLGGALVGMYVALWLGKRFR